METDCAVIVESLNIEIGASLTVPELLLIDSPNPEPTDLDVSMVIENTGPNPVLMTGVVIPLSFSREAKLTSPLNEFYQEDPEFFDIGCFFAFFQDTEGEPKILCDYMKVR